MRSGAPVGGLRIGILLASSSVAALLIGGGARPAFAACANVVGPGAVASFTNPTGSTIPCVTFSGATVSECRQRRHHLAGRLERHNLLQRHRLSQNDNPRLGQQ